MYRLVLGCLLASALMDAAAACPPAQSRVAIVDGKEVIEWYCPSHKVMVMHENIYRCFDRCPACPNGFCHENKCHCFPGTQPERPGVCGKICPNCANGWCSSRTKCECNDGFVSSNGQCVALPRPSPNGPPGYPYWPPQWDTNQPPPVNPQYPPWYFKQPPGQDPQTPPKSEDDGFGKIEGRMGQPDSDEYMPQYFQ